MGYFFCRLLVRRLLVSLFCVLEIASYFFISFFADVFTENSYCRQITSTDLGSVYKLKDINFRCLMAAQWKADVKLLVEVSEYFIEPSAKDCAADMSRDFFSSKF